MWRSAVKSDNGTAVQMTPAFTLGMKISLRSKMLRLTIYGVIITGQDTCTKIYLIIYHFIDHIAYTMCVRAQSCPGLCDPLDCSPPSSSVLGILQARMLEWVTISSSRGSSRPRDRTLIFSTGRQILSHCATWEAQHISYYITYHIVSNFIHRAQKGASHFTLEEPKTQRGL